METFKTNDLVTLQEIEIRIAADFHSAARNLIDVGRCLNEAKARGLVPHGQWEAWVELHTGLKIGKAQRLMRMAREVPEDSAMARISFTSVVSLLALPDPEQREALAQEAERDNLTVRQLQAKIEELTNRGKDREKEVINLRNRDTQREEMLDKLSSANTEAKARCRELETRINELIASQNEVINEEVAGKVAERVKALEKELDEAREYAAAQAEKRQAAEQELLNAQMSQAKGETYTQRFGADDLNSAVRAFLGEAGVVAHMGAEMAGMDEGEKREMRKALDRMQDFINAARKALGTVVVSVDE